MLRSKQKANESTLCHKVLHVFADPATGVLLVASIAKTQRAQGYHVEFASGDGENLPSLKNLGFPVTVVPIVRRFIALTHFVAVYNLWRLMKRQRYTVVHVHTPIAAFLGRLSAQLAGVPVVIHHMRGSWWDSTSRLMQAFFTVIETVAGRWTTHTFTINCSDAADLVSRSGLNGNSVTCLHCGAGGVDIHRFSPNVLTSPVIADERRRMEFEPDDIIIGFVGRLVREKGLFELIEAFSSFTSFYPRVKLLIVGGTLKSERDQETGRGLQDRVASDPLLRGRVTFTGFRQDIHNILAMIDILVLPSHREAFGMVLAEAAAAGLPVVCTMTRGGREAVVDGETGILVPIGDVTALANALRLLVSDSSLRIQFGKNARHRAVERFNQDRVQAMIGDVYERVLGRLSRP